MQSYGRYTVHKLLGEGAMGRVYLAEDPILKRLVAVKVISTDRQLGQNVLNEYLERFKLEAQACAKLNHPSIVSIYDAGEQDGVPWIAFEYVSGEHLGKQIANQKQIPFDRIVQIAGDIAAAMHHAHGMNIVHRDIKPANILIDNKSQIAKLADFGVVKSRITAITQSGTTVGSPGYMSPEQIDNLEVDARSDIFSFGIVLYEMITGTHPFLRDTVQATFFATISCNYKPVNELRDGVPEKLARVVDKSLVANRNSRIMDAEKLCLMIAECSEEGGRTVSLPRIGNTNRKISERMKKLYFAASREVKIFWKKAAPFGKRALDAVVSFYKNKIVPFIDTVLQKIYASLEPRFTKSQITIALTGLVSLIMALAIIILIAVASGGSNDKKDMIKAARAIGYEIKDGKQLVEISRGYIAKCDYPSIEQTAKILAASGKNEFALKGRLYNAMAALCADRFNDASDLFSEVIKLDGGANAIRKEHQFFIGYLENWIERELPEALTNLCAERLYLHNSFQVKTWTKDHHYWIRWNAVRIMQKGGVAVDLVPVYILDLDHAASAKTRIRAAERLGDIGDRRAVPALTAVRNNRSHPAASTARRVLREKFNVW